MKKYCKYCGAPLREGQVFCEQCGRRVDGNARPTTAPASQPTMTTQPATSQQSQPTQVTAVPKHAARSGQPTTAPTQPRADREQAELQARIVKLESQLRDQQQNNKVNVFHRLAFSRRHWRQVFRFMNNNAMTMLVFFIVALYFVMLRWWIFLIFILLTYLYPLLANEQNYPWEVAFNRWLNDQDTLTKLKGQLQRAQEKSRQAFSKATLVNHSVNPNVTTAERANGQSTAQPTTQATAQRTAAPRQSGGFKSNAEFIAGIVLAVVGAILYFGFADAASSTSQQVMSVLENQSLSTSGYAVFWGLSLGVLGVMMFIGGLVKGFKHGHRGRGLKILGAVLLLAFAVVTSYIYANAAAMAVNAASSVLTGDSSISDLENLANIVRSLQWIGAVVYAIGILMNGLAGGHHE